MNNVKKFLPLLILILVEAALFVTNYKSGTYFLGWDNLFPEMNFQANISRSIFAAWQEYRGLGLLDGMSYAANLPHYLFLWLTSLILPQDLLRYFFFFLMHLLGGVGMYLFLTKELVKRPLTAFFGALFYMFNLATIQMFFAPYELFAVHFAFLPWLVWFILNYLRTGSRKTLLLFSLFSLAAVPQAHVPTVFLVYLAVVGIILLFNLNFKRGLLILIMIFAVNAFWLLPYGYGILRGGASTVIDSKINQMSRVNIYANQKARGDLVNVLTLKGFLLDASEFDKQANQTGHIMSPWTQHNDLPPIAIITGLFLLLAIFGVIAILRHREKHLYPFLVISFGAFFFLASNTPVFDFLNNLLRDNVSLIGEGFRFSFTKFSIVFAFTYTIFIVYGIEEFIKKGILKILLIIALLAYTWPSFQGNFFFDSLRVQIPMEYSQVVSYFRTQPLDTRVGLFPQPSFWSWRFYDFGYRGSGFLWYGIPQPTMDLAFDPWSREDENYYWEISQAVYSKNLPLFESVLEKYRVNWLLVDENIIDPSSPKALYTNELESMIKNSNSIRIQQVFGKIRIYEFRLRVTTKSFVSIVQNLPGVGPSFRWGNLDQGYFDNGDYLTVENGAIEDSNLKIENRVLNSIFNHQPSTTTFYSQPSIVYSYRTLFTGRTQTDLEFDPTKLNRLTSNPIIKIGPENDKNAWAFPALSHRDGYLVTVKAKNTTGKPFLFWIEDLNSRRSVLETYLSTNYQLPTTNYFVLPPMEPDGLGYAFHLDSNTIGIEVSKNELESLEVWPIDYFGLISQRTISNLGNLSHTSYLNSYIVEHPNPALYRIDLKVNKLSTIILAQSFDNGWVALGAKNHILVSNWANGWEVDPGPRVVYLFYWPQLLEFAGFGILTIFVLSLIIKLLVFPQRFFVQNASTK